MRAERQQRSVSRLQAALSKTLMGEAAHRLFEVEAGVRPNFEAFPKNEVGHIPTEEIFPAIVRNYFAKEHGWLIKGLEPPSWQTASSKVEDVAIFRDRAKEVVAALEEVSRSDKGLSLSDIVGTIAVLEHLIVEESMNLLDEAYFVSGTPKQDAVDENVAHQILRSYLLLYRWGAPLNETNAAEFEDIKKNAAQATDWASMVKFELNSFDKARGDLPEGSKYDYRVLQVAVRDMAVKYGRWQNSECEDMKGTLVALARDKHSGLVPFLAFRSEPNHAAYQFTETAEYLDKLGVLVAPTSATDDAKVRIANYLLGPTNCIAPTAYFMVCCLSECEDVVSEIETRIQSPVATADQLLSVTQDIGTSTLQAPHSFSETVVGSLRQVGRSYEGLVPLHSAEFRQWLNVAFPNECPYLTPPEVAAQNTELTVASHWLQGQHVCTRLPEWHPAIVASSARVDAIGEIEAEVAVDV